jgi:hypothetical protein
MKAKSVLRSVISGLFRNHMETAGLHQYPLCLNTDQAYVGWPELGRRIAVMAPEIPKRQLMPKGPFLTCLSPESHVGPFAHAIDFLVPDDEPVLASEAGIIETVVEGNKVHGPTRDFAGHLNYVTIRHEFGGNIEFSQYCHLRQNSIHEIGLKVGDTVTKGQEIALTGMTGWTDRPHLHFIAFRACPGEFGFHSLVVRFAPFEVEGKQLYYSAP